MRILLRTIAAFALSTSSTLVVAQDNVTARQELEIVARAEPACVARAPSATAGINATYDPVGDNGGEVRIVQLVSSADAEPLPASITLTLPVVCNASHRVELRSLNGGLLRDSGNPQSRQSSTGFGDFVPYQLGFGWAGQQRNSSSEEARSMVFAVPRGAAGDATFSFALTGGGGPLAAGRYSDSIIIEFQPAI